MAKKQATRRTVAVTNGAAAAAATDTDDERTPLDDIEEEMEEGMALDLQAALAECGDGGQVSIQLFKTSPKEEAGACTTYSSAELSIDRIREEWGAGIYKLFFRNPKGQILTRKQLSVVAKVKPAQSAPADIAKLVQEAQQAGNAGSNNMMLLVMKMMETQSAQLVAALGRPMPQPQTFGPSEMVAMMTGLATIMKPAAPAESPVDSLLKGVKLMKDMREGSDDSDSVLGVVSKGIEAATTLLGNRGEQPPQQTSRPVTATVVKPQPAAVPAIQTPVATEPASEAPTKDELESVTQAKIAWLREQVRRLVDKAKKSKDPVLYADLLLDELPEFITVEDIRVALMSATWWERLVLLHSDASDYHVWFAEFRDAIAERIAEAQQTFDAQEPENAQGKTEGAPEVSTTL